MQGEHLLGNMRQRQIGEGAVIRPQIDEAAGDSGGPGEVPMGEHHPFGGPRGSGGVNQRGDLIRLQSLHRLLHPALLHRLAPGQKRVPTKHHRVFHRLGGPHHHHMAQLRQTVTLLPNLLPLLPVFNEDERRLRVLDDVLNLPGGAGGIDTSGDTPHRHRGQIHHHPLRSIEAQNAHGLTSPDSQPVQCPGRQSNLLHVGTPGGGEPRLVAPNIVSRRVRPDPLLPKKSR